MRAIKKNLRATVANLILVDSIVSKTGIHLLFKSHPAMFYCGEEGVERVCFSLWRYLFSGHW